MIATGPIDLTVHETHVRDAMLGIIDYASRVLCAASAGSIYQRDKAHELRYQTDRLIRLLDKAPLDHAASARVEAAVAADAGKFTLGHALLAAGVLGGTA